MKTLKPLRLKTVILTADSVGRAMRVKMTTGHLISLSEGCHNYKFKLQDLTRTNSLGISCEIVPRAGHCIYNDRPDSELMTSFDVTKTNIGCYEFGEKTMARVFARGKKVAAAIKAGREIEDTPLTVALQKVRAKTRAAAAGRAKTKAKTKKKTRR